MVNIINKINALIISDTHGTLTEDIFYNFINNKKIDLFILLGDIEISDWKVLINNEMFRNTLKISVCGNHDINTTIKDINIKLKEYMNSKEITDLHNNYVSINNISFVGISGSIKYKKTIKNNTCMYTQGEFYNIAKNLPQADIILTHDAPKIDKDLSNELSLNAHYGVYGIFYYMNKYNAINFHGHLHNNYIDKILGEYSFYQLNYIHIYKVFSKLFILPNYS